LIIIYIRICNLNVADGTILQQEFELHDVTPSLNNTTNISHVSLLQ